MYNLVDIIEELNLFEPNLIEYNAGDVILAENTKNSQLFVLLDGMVHLFKESPSGTRIPLTEIMPGGMFGVMSFFSRNVALTTAVAEIRSKILCLSGQQVEILLESDSRIAGMGRQLLINNLMERYSQVVELNVKLKSTNLALDAEKKRLAQTLEELDSAHRRLVHQEKMATLGQLVAGVAHEINNPASALSNAVEYLVTKLPNLFAEGESSTSDLRIAFFLQGLSAAIINTAEQRDKTSGLDGIFDELKSSERRKIIYLTDELKTEAAALIKSGKTQELGVYIDYLETGMHLRSIRLTSSRISELVKSLKRYSRHESSHQGKTVLREGLEDTLQILGNRLKQVELELEIPDDLPQIVADAAELNQVWTNLIVNACDAIGDQGRIYIRCSYDTQCVFVKIGDDGKGIPEELRDAVFKPHFTTRNSSGNFGLGLGLSISKELVMKNGGTITVAKSSWDGAELIVMLPLSD